METTTTTERRTPYEWWFDSRNTCCLACSPWLLSTLSDLNEKTHAMLRMLEEDADTFAQRAEMYYEKRPQLISLVEDFYRAQRSLLEQFDHLRGHDVSTRECHISPLASSSKPLDDDSFTKNPPKPLDECHEVGYESEVDDFLPEVCYEAEDFGGEELKSEKLMAEIEKLNEEIMVRDHQTMEKDKAIEEMQRKLVEVEDEVVELTREIEEMSGIVKRSEVERERTKMALEKVRAENEFLNNELAEKDKEKREAMEKLAEELGVVSLKNEERRELLEMKDEEKREVIRQLSLTIEMLKAENVVFKDCLSSKRSLFNCFETSQSRVLLC